MIKYILNVKRWTDRTYGNTYFSARAQDLEGKTILYLPFQYGYGHHAETVAAEALNCEMSEIFAAYSDEKQKNVEAWGHEIKGPFRVIMNGKRGKVYETTPEVYAAMDTMKNGDTVKVKDASGFVFIQRHKVEA